MRKRRADGAESGQQQYSRPITRNVLTDDLRCRRCSSSIELAADHVVLSPCGCRLCPECLLEVLAEKGAGEVDCPCCSASVSSHQFHKARQPRREIVKHACQSQSQMSAEEMLLKHPQMALVSANVELLRNAPNDACEMLLLLYGICYSRESAMQRTGPLKSVSSHSSELRISL